MDKNLANYLFHNETLYTEPKKLVEDGVSENIKVEESKAQKPELVSSETVAPVAPVAPDEEPMLTDMVPESIPFKMNTAHLIVLTGINTEEKEFLVKILMALNMSLAKTDLLDTLTHSNPNFKEIIYNNAVRTILFLGSESGGDFLPKLKLLPYQVKELKQIKFLSSASLEEVSLNANNEKRQLWESLKDLYQ